MYLVIRDYSNEIIWDFICPLQIFWIIPIRNLDEVGQNIWFIFHDNTFDFLAGHIHWPISNSSKLSLNQHFLPFFSNYVVTAQPLVNSRERFIFFGQFLGHPAAVLWHIWLAGHRLWPDFERLSKNKIKKLFASKIQYNCTVLLNKYQKIK